jgi:hypothetical protein
MSEELQENKSDVFDLVDVPSVEDYKNALKASKAALKSSDGRSLILDMLTAHYQAPDHTLTAGELADKVNLELRAANLRYGNYAKELCKQLGRKPESRAAIAKGKRPLWVSMLVKFSGGTPGSRPDEDESIRWTLLPEVVQALEQTFLSHLKPDDD